MESSKKKMTFESALAELEDITRRLERGNESLEDSMELYTRGVELKEFCEKKLKEAEKKWKVLKKDKNTGDIVTGDFSLEMEDSGESSNS